MPNRFAHSALFATLLALGAARAASAQTCIAIDDARDTLVNDERAAALVLVASEFERAGQRVAREACTATYVLSHLRLGTRIIVSLSGSLGSRQATAVGLDDLPAIYSQMVRSLTSGQPMGSTPVVDRTNVSASQDGPPRRIHTDGVWYARLGNGSVFAEDTHHGPVFGFGYRAEFDRLGLDFSFLNLQPNDFGSYYDAHSSASSFIKLQGLYFTNPTGDRSAYFGGGMSYGRIETRSRQDDGFPKTGRASGLQGELTAGYELARTTSIRLFAQADVTLPLYHVIFETFEYPRSPSGGFAGPPTITVEREYVPSLAVSVGLGWQRRAR